MKHRLLAFALIAFSLSSGKMIADQVISTDTVSTESIAPQKEKKSPFSFQILFDKIAQSEIAHGYFKKDKIDFATATANAGMIFYYNPTYTEGANVAVGYTSTAIKWNQNPWFDQTHFDDVSLVFGGFSKRLDRWFWRGQLSFNYDLGSRFGMDYFNYDIIMWGRYSLCNNIGFHLGIYAQTGMKLDRVLPIIGLDWAFAKDWKLNLVFPFNISLAYSPSPKWTIALAERNFNVRYRVKRDECHGQSLLRYTNVGFEFTVLYDYNNLTVNLHGGYSVDGDLRVSNKFNHHPHHYYTNAAAYGGAEVNIRF